MLVISTSDKHMLGKLIMAMIMTILIPSFSGVGWKQESTNGEYAERFSALDQESRARVDELMR